MKLAIKYFVERNNATKFSNHGYRVYKWIVGKGKRYQGNFGSKQDQGQRRLQQTPNESWWHGQSFCISVKKIIFIKNPHRSHCLKITQNVSFEFFNFGNFSPIFVLLKLTCLVTLFDRKLQIFKNSPKLAIFGNLN